MFVRVCPFFIFELLSFGHFSWHHLNLIIFCRLDGRVAFSISSSIRLSWVQIPALFTNVQTCPVYSQTALLFLQQMALLGFFLPPYAAAWFKPTSVELNQTRTFEGLSTVWATAPRHGITLSKRYLLWDLNPASPLSWKLFPFLCCPFSRTHPTSSRTCLDHPISRPPVPHLSRARFFPFRKCQNSEVRRKISAAQRRRPAAAVAGTGRTCSGGTAVSDSDRFNRCRHPHPVRNFSVKPRWCHFDHFR